MSVSVQAEDFDISAEITLLTSGRSDIGGVASFIGLVRELHPDADGTEQQSMTLEHYPGMTERQLEKLEAEATERWPLLGTRIVHRVGKLAPGDQIVLVIACSRHRQAAFDAANFLMDYLKSRAPFWKLEERDGVGAWVDARDSDRKALTRWR